MIDQELTVTPTQMHVSGANSLVPAGYAEKAMASLMQLHGELMNEKERRVDLYRRLMEKEQVLAELKMYVKLLEEKIERPARKAVPPTSATPAARAQPAPVARSAPKPPPAISIVRSVPKPPSVGARTVAMRREIETPRRAAGGQSRSAEGWKSW